jgi:hypothetical protein
MLYQMKTLNFEKVRNEFIMLTLFHGEQFCEQISTIELDEETKNGFIKLVNGF